MSGWVDEWVGGWVHGLKDRGVRGSWMGKRVVSAWVDEWKSTQVYKEIAWVSRRVCGWEGA